MTHPTETHPTDPDLHVLAAEIVSGLADWRTQHPTATFRAIEAEVESRLACLRASMLASAAHQSAALAWQDHPPDQQPHCPTCHLPLQQRGREERTLRSQHNQPVTLSRCYGTCPHCGDGFFPPR